MNQHNNEQPRPIACAELKAAMSAYLDDELTRDERLRADAHLVGCDKCRDLIERAERLDDTLRDQFARDVEEASAVFAADPVDTKSIEAGVLAAIGAPPKRQWLPRLAIAAGIAAAAITGIVLWNKGDGAQSLAPMGPGQFANGSNAPRAIDPIAAPSGASVQLAGLDADERQLLYSTGVILSNIRKADFEHTASATQLREVARYDELVGRLDSIVGRVAPEDRPTVALARDAIEFLLDTPTESDRWESIRRDMERTELDRRLNTLSDT